jgi:hypothetical protein
VVKATETRGAMLRAPANQAYPNPNPTTHQMNPPILHSALTKRRRQISIVI